MAKVRFNENGDLINDDTGQIVGNSLGDGNIQFNSDNAQLKSLQQMGVSLPDQEEFIQQQQKKSLDENINNNVVFSENVINKDDFNKNYSSIKLTLTKYEVTPNSNFVIKFGLLQRQDGRFTPIKVSQIDDFPYAEEHWVKFRMWRFDQELIWKKQCLQYNSSLKYQMINTEKLNQKKIKNLILDWSFGYEQQRLKLLHCDNQLSDESYTIFKGLYPSIANTIIDMMNNVLENNQ